MRMILFVFTSLLLGSGVNGQTLNPAPFNKSRATINKRGLLVIGSWAAANILYSGVAAGKSSGSTRYFHQMNTIWNGVTLGIAGLGLLRQQQEHDGLVNAFKEQSGIEKVFLLNAGLDLGYVAAGAYLRERSNNSGDRAKLTGYGESIMVQGVTLFVFDGIMYVLHQNYGRKLYRAASKLHVSSGGNGIGLRYRFGSRI
ncbi:hypothetical protein EXU57_11690 [Segetibacter sp. 3557_3]|uniref:DUF6992 family protein n=1 Tax=Segetibacter sp. 3557_3 TaxID=2547429 RepID=UPI001058657D|nr:hypothetical protein [Segetibacter sp. 3557_3]TDH26147.1 hypothetical protein EXU57_11690 [Segetibacter sp. 3557_3]